MNHMTSKVSPIPPGFHTLTPYLVCRGAAAAIEFYGRAFGAEAYERMSGPDGKLMHAMIKIGDSPVFLTDEIEEQGARSPQSLGGSPISLFVFVPDVDALFARAVAAGAQPLKAPTDMFWGDRWGMLADPFGHVWQLATRKEEVSREEMGRRMQQQSGC